MLTFADATAFVDGHIVHIHLKLGEVVYALFGTVVWFVGLSTDFMVNYVPVFVDAFIEKATEKVRNAIKAEMNAFVGAHREEAPWDSIGDELVRYFGKK